MISLPIIPNSICILREKLITARKYEILKHDFEFVCFRTLFGDTKYVTKT